MRFIKQSKDLGYTLAEIKQLISFHDAGGNATEIRALATAKIENIKQRIKDLEEMRDQLENLVSRCQCGTKSQPDCPAIKQLDYASHIGLKKN